MADDERCVLLKKEEEHRHSSKVPKANLVVFGRNLRNLGKDLTTEKTLQPTSC